MSVQSKLLKFHDKIKMSDSLKKELREKRDILLNKVRKDKDLPGFEELEQGSYAMYLGVKPEKEQEYDIDVALRFNANKADFDPMDLKNKLFDTLKNHTEYGAMIKKPCVTVTYQKDGEATFHVDLVVYTYENKDDKTSQMYIAKGKDKDSESWEKADPKGLIDYINDSVKEEHRNQFRRVIRYLKKWRNIRFTSTEHASPPSIGITLIAADYFNYYVGNDLDSLINIVSAIINKFIFVGASDSGRQLYKINQSLPSTLSFEVGNDVFEKMSTIQMTDFKDKIEKFKNDLLAVRNEVDEYEQYKKLNRIFGDDFDIPDEITTAKQQRNFIPSSSASGQE